MCLSLSAHCRLDLSLGRGRTLCITRWHQDSHGFSHLRPVGDEGRGCEREAGEWGAAKREEKRFVAGIRWDLGEIIWKTETWKWEGRGFFICGDFFEQPERNWSSFVAAGGLHISSQINLPQRRPNGSLLTLAFLSVLEMTRNQVKSGPHCYGFFVKKKNNNNKALVGQKKKKNNYLE